MARSRVAGALLGRVHLGSDRFALKVETGTAGGWLTGPRQSRATGLAAALVIKRLPAMPAGVHHLEQAVDAGEFLRELAGFGFTLST
ncbi:hypothetical protein ACIBHX_28245 [Nonomuraea sp. NPDC050536]|uniref:hypothetical protein n=1 Tax=Nonomuraea sp. NPDC050536 TaxID=3364366 RepID=UPI0037C9A899